MPSLPVEFAADPAWPWSASRIGLPALAGVALVLAGLTIWTYRGVHAANRRRVAIVLGLRLLALILAVFTVLRPAVTFRDDLKTPSTLLIAADGSLSMSIKDEVDNKSRWAALQRVLIASKDQLDRLRDDYNVNVVLVRFAEEVSDYDPDGKADGQRTDFGRLLHTLHQRYSAERRLRGLLVLSDGADNGTLYPALAEAARWRSLGCPVSTFALGQETTSTDQRDIAITTLTPEPSPVPVKGKLTVRATLDAHGFENREVQLHLLLDDKEVKVQATRLPKTTGNEIEMTTDAPANPGEVKLTLRADPLPGEATTSNNEISTYLTVTKEGLSVLIVDRLREELKFIRSALSGDPRIRLFEAVRQTSDPPPAGDADLFQFDKQAYDVIILGDVSYERLRSASRNADAKIEELVREKGVGLLMTGGEDSLGRDWVGTKVAQALPVELDGAQVDEIVPFLPDPQALPSDYILRLAPNPRDSALLWTKLNEPIQCRMNGYTRLGKPKSAAAVLARARDARDGPPLLVRQTYGKGRTAALAVDSTWHWLQYGLPKSTEGVELHARFWKQLVIYLAQQENQGGAVWVRPDNRRLAAGGKVNFTVGLRGKTGIDLPDGKFDVSVLPPGGGKPEPVPTAAEREGQKGSFWKTDKPGEYTIVVAGKGKDADGADVTGEARARFIVYWDDTELLREAADHDFLRKLASAGGGKFHRADELPKVLRELERTAPEAGRQKAVYWPDWRRATLGGFLPGLFLAFVAVLGLEWGLRRYWGMV
ncbi:MAG TPA: glutamine amidotransferase [Gemmataceae bacterium]|jgi:uncharacterized membrane protein|nr:glutamine amidotransferase [Gemmataceae bacterium]